MHLGHRAAAIARPEARARRFATRFAEAFL
jgi:hypothetical protein